MERNMRRIALALAAMMMAVPALADGPSGPVCDARSEVLGHLAGKYHESPVALGLATNGGVVELLTAVDGKTWTIVITLPNGQTCLVAAGENWENQPQAALGTES
jgi:hypothetical protein